MNNFKYAAITIDGPSGSGKTTLAKRISEELEILFVNSGAMYRSVTWLALEEFGRDFSNDQVSQLMLDLPISFKADFLQSTIEYKGELLDDLLRDSSVNEQVSRVSEIEIVRDYLVKQQRNYLKQNYVVMEGRDIGSVVFPDTPYKFYLEANLEIREQRRSADKEVDLIKQRDKIDSQRKHSPLIVPRGAYQLDSSSLTVEELYQQVIKILYEKDFPFKPSA